MAAGQLALVRHGLTDWAESGRHTGLTDVPLEARGENQARALGVLVERLLGRRPAAVLVSPLVRARRTAELAGLEPAVVEDDLVEWDYGADEGLTTPEIRERRGGSWEIFTDGVAPGGPGGSPGETLEQVAERGRRVLSRVAPLLETGDVAVVGHGHALRVLATQWLRLPASAGLRLYLDTATVSVLGHHHDDAVLHHWNVPPT